MKQVRIGQRTWTFLILAVWAASQTAISVAWAQRQRPPAKVLAYPNLVLYNGKVLTADDEFTITEAVAIRDGKFLEVGNNDAVLELAGPNKKDRPKGENRYSWFHCPPPAPPGLCVLCDAQE